MCAFNAKNICNRNLDQMKVKYDNLKCKARKIYAADKIYMQGTGGGPAGNSETDPVIEAVLRIINKKTVTGLHNPFDTDCISTDFNTNRIDNNKENEEQMANSNIIIVGSENLSCPSSQQDGPVILFDHDNWENQNTNLINLDDVGKDNSQKNKTVLHEEQAQNTTTSISIKPQSKQANNQKESGSSWSTYTPKKMRQPIARKLRQTITNPVREEYYKVKLELVREEIKKSRLEQEELIRKQKYDVEEHGKKMQLLDIEIKLKQKMLNEK